MKLTQKYNANGELVSIQSEDGHQWEYDYNSEGEVKLASESWSEYDERGNVIHFRDTRGQEYWYKYDERGNMIYEECNIGYKCWSEYDENNNLIHRRNSAGQNVWYDENGELIRDESEDLFWYIN